MNRPDSLREIGLQATVRSGRIVVLGMHRSGTSCVANVLNAMGAHYAEDGVENLVTRDNPRGFWEHPELCAICNRLLQASGREWWAVDGFQLENVARPVLEESQAAFATLLAKLDAHQPWFIKEPRLCVLLPVLLPLLDDPVIVHVWRHPLEVAESLRVRNGFSLDFGIALWEAHVRSAFRASHGLKSVVVGYGRLVASPAQEVAQLLHGLARAGIGSLSMPDAQGLAEAVDATLRRSARDIDAADLLLPPQLELLAALESGDPAHPALRGELSRGARIRLEDAGERNALLQSLQKQAAYGRQNSWFVGRFESMERAIRLADGKALRDGMSAIDKRLQSVADGKALRDGMSAIDKRLQSVADGKALRDGMSAIDKRLQSVDKMHDQVTTLSQRAARDAAKIDTLSRRIDEQDRAMREAGAELADKERRIDDLQRRLRFEQQPFLARLTQGAALLDGSAPREGLSAKSRLALRLRYRLIHRRGDAAQLAEMAASGLFEHGWYLAQYPDVARAGMDPVVHYCDHGWREGRDPGPAFQTSFYLARNPDVADAGMNPLLHYLRYGRGEKRTTAAAQPKSAQRAAPRPAGQRRIVVYTAIVGGYDELMVPAAASQRCDFVCFTDREIPGERGWTLRPMDYLSSVPARAARFVKTHPHLYFPDHDWSVWVDANLLVRADLSELVDAAERAHELFCTFLHPHRDCAYAEAEEVIERKLDEPETVRAQMARCKAAGYPPNNGLAETNVLVRRHNDPRVVALDLDWWREIEHGSHRDQLSLNYAAHKRMLRLGAIAKRGISVRNDPRLSRFLHGRDSTYRLPAPLAEDAKRAPAPAAWAERRGGPGLVTPADLAAIEAIPVDIIVCVHDAPEDARRCLESVAVHQRPCESIILVDDGSQSPAADYCREFAARTPRARLLRREQASGYTRAANTGLRESRAAYVVLLNSDTVVARNWAAKLVHAGESAADVGLVGPMSNAASWQSIPETTDGKGDLAVNPLPPGCDVRHMDQLCELWSQAPLLPRVSLLNGFCLAIKRKVIDAIGLLDEEAFPQGYGEENDYCFRAADAGFGLLVATHTFVYHAKSKSYTHERRHELARIGGDAFRARHGERRIARAVTSTRDNPLLGRLRAAARRIWPADAARPGEGLRLLFLLPVAPGGGGAHSVMQEAAGLRALGADAAVAVPQAHRAEYEAQYGPALTAAIAWYSSVDELVELARPCAAVVATAYASVALLERVAAVHPGVLPGYYVQDYEPLFYDRPDTPRNRERRAAALRSYCALPQMLRFAKTAWLQQTVQAGAGARTWKVQPSIDHAVYHPGATPRAPGPVRIAAMVRVRSARRSPELTMRVLARLARAHGDAVSLHVFGTATDDEALLALRGEAPITCHGALRREEVAALLREADLFADLSVYQAFGRTALEAMACGCAVVVPREGGAAEFARDGVNARLADTASEDACYAMLDELVRDGTQRSRLAERALGTAEGYSIEAAAMSELVLLKSALALRPGSAAPARAASGAAAGNPHLEPELAMSEISAQALQANAGVVAAMRRLERVPVGTLLWLVPGFDSIYRGGIRTVFMAAEYLARTRGSRNLFAIYGHEKVPLRAIEAMASQAFPALNGEMIRLPEGAGPESLPACDAAFATLWTSAYLLARYDKCRAKFYFVQDFEPSFYPAGSVYGAIEQTYRLGFHGIANSVGVARRYREYSDWVDYFTPGVDRALYRPAPRAPGDPWRIVFYGRPNNHRNAFNLGIEALRQVKERLAGKVEILSVGGNWPEHRYRLRGVVRNLGVLPDIGEVAALYRSCDLGLVFMFSEHPSYQPLEYMASGCCTVTNFNPATRWLLRDRANAFLSGSTSASVAQCIVDALEDEAARRRVIEGGLKTVASLGWDDALERIARFVEQPRPAQGALEPPPCAALVDSL